MNDWKDTVFEKWWPLSQAMTLVRAPIRRVAKSMKAEGRRAKNSTGANYEYDWVKFDSIDDLFRSVDKFVIGSSLQIALPTTGEWTVIWDNSSLCTGGYIGYRLTKFKKLETISFYSTDRNSTQLAGTHFTHHRPGLGEEVIERTVYCCNQGKRWHFEQTGEPLPQEDMTRYSVKRKRDRMNEAVLMDLFGRLGVHPWRESTYNFRKKCFREIHARHHAPAEGFTFEQIRVRALGEAPPPAEDEELRGPPDYLLEKCGTTDPSSPSQLLVGGEWCGHGEQTFWVYDIFTRNKDLFSVRLPTPDGVPVVEVVPRSGGEPLVIYDARCHPANVYFGSDQQPVFQPNVTCPKCRSETFQVSVGFEVPPDAVSANDTSWFTLALQCEGCRNRYVAYEDETA